MTYAVTDATIEIMNDWGDTMFGVPDLAPVIIEFYTAHYGADPNDDINGWNAFHEAFLGADDMDGFVQSIVDEIPPAVLDRPVFNGPGIALTVGHVISNETIRRNLESASFYTIVHPDGREFVFAPA